MFVGEVCGLIYLVSLFLRGFEILRFFRGFLIFFKKSLVCGLEVLFFEVVGRV